MEKGKFNVVVDSAWGSSAKGAVSSRLADIFKTENLSTCNFPNAGHTFLNDNVKFISKVLPTGAILRSQSNFIPTLWVGPNSGFELEQFKKELSETGYDVGHFLKIHARSIIVTDAHKLAESPVGDKSTLRISSTMSGSGAAFSEKAMRGEAVQLASSVIDGCNDPQEFFELTRIALARGETFLHEVSQGFALGINYGTHYPFCTFRECTPQQSYADFGITPKLVGDVYLNVRSFPIRVGSNFDENGKMIGYSGDVMYDQKELSWLEVGKNAEMPESEIQILAEKERTTVTKKIRRVFTPSWELLRYSAEFTGATKLVLNFPQYIHWSSYGIKGGDSEFKQLHPKVREYVETMENVTNLPVVMIGTGPKHDEFIYRG